MQRVLQCAAHWRLQARNQARHLYLQGPPGGQRSEQKRIDRVNRAQRRQEVPSLFRAAGTCRRSRHEAGQPDLSPRVVDGLGPADAVGQAEVFPGRSAGGQEVLRGLQGSWTATDP